MTDLQNKSDWLVEFLTSPDVVLIPVSQGYYAIIDKDDYRLVSKHSWSLHIGQNTHYAIASKPKTRTTMSMHRLIMHFPREMQVDHINGNGLDNRRENLRLCTNSDNHGNATRSSNNKTGYKGVLWLPRRKKYKAYITKNKVTRFLGQFDDPELAALAYDEAARELYGEFAKTNESMGYLALQKEKE